MTMTASPLGSWPLGNYSELRTNILRLSSVVPVDEVVVTGTTNRKIRSSGWMEFGVKKIFQNFLPLSTVITTTIIVTYTPVYKKIHTNDFPQYSSSLPN